MMKRAKLTAQQQKKRDVLLDVLTVLFACPLISAAIAVFNVPNDIAPGGVAGLSTALAEVFPPISVGVWMVMLNTPLLLAAWRRFKRRALVMTLAATGSVAVLVDIFGLLLPAYSNNPLLAAIAGGTFTGLGAGLLLQRGISTGGTDLLALLLRRIFPNLRTGMLMLCIDISVVTFAVIVFKDIEVALYSAIAIFIVSKIVDAIAQGVDYAKVIYTVTEHGDEVSRAVTERADRGTTIVKVVPSPSVLLTVISPLICWTRFFTMGMPRPVPVTPTGANIVSRANGSNTCSRNSSDMPTPGSLTSMQNLSSLSDLPAISVVTFTVAPGRLYLSALEMRLLSTWLMRLRSQYTSSCSSASSQTSVLSSRAACSTKSPTVSSTQARMSIGW